MKRFLKILVGPICAITLTGCNWFLDDSLGKLDGPCFDDLSCNEGLVCNEEQICIKDEAREDGDADDEQSESDGDYEIIGEGPAEIEWIRIPATTVRIGCLASDTECLDAERPAHEVTLEAFEIMKKEMTISQADILIEVVDNGPPPPMFYDCEDCPIVDINWSKAAVLCQLAGGELPSEAQWEVAARAAQQKLFGCGDTESCLPAFAWYSDNANGKLHDVATLAPNPFGLYDMSGNAAEWIRDTYQETYEGAPVDGSSWEVEGAPLRVVRGGSFDASPAVLRLSYRSGLDPTQGYDRVGLRCVRSPKN